MITIAKTQLLGVEELTAALRIALAYHDEGKVRKALGKGSKIIIDEAKSRVKVDTGNLKESIKQLPKFRRDPWSIYIGPRVRRTSRREGLAMAKSVGVGVSAPYANFVEYGTDPHNLGYKGKYVSGKGAEHPGAKKQPYMRPAYDTKGQEALNVAMKEVWKMIEDKVSSGQIQMMVQNTKGGKRLY